MVYQIAKTISTWLTKSLKVLKMIQLKVTYDQSISFIFRKVLLAKYYRRFEKTIIGNRLRLFHMNCSLITSFHLGIKSEFEYRKLNCRLKITYYCLFACLLTGISTVIKSCVIAQPIKGHFWKRSENAVCTNSVL